MRETSRIGHIKFNDNVEKTNPGWFIRRFEDAAQSEGLNASEKSTALTNAMQGDDMQWVNTTDAGSYIQLRQEFLSKYWNDGIQQKVADYIWDGKYDYKTETSMEMYFRNWAVHANYSTHLRNDQWVVNRLKGHLNERIQVKLELK